MCTSGQCHLECVCVCKVELLLSGDYKVCDGGLVDEFKAVRLEFHWSNTSKRGSEHYINDTAFPLEVCLLYSVLI